MGFPVSYFDPAGRAVEGAARAGKVYDGLEPEYVDRMKWAIRRLNSCGLVVTLEEKPLEGCIARVRIDAYGKSASEVESTLLAYGGRADAASEASGCSYGECVIERNLEAQWGKPYSWRGRLILHPNIGETPDSERAADAVEK